MFDSMRDASKDAKTVSPYSTPPVNPHLFLHCLQSRFLTLREVLCPKARGGSVYQRKRSPAPPSREQAIGSPSEAILA